MKIRGGYVPGIAGRPSSVVEEVGLSGQLAVSLARREKAYRSLVNTGDKVRRGNPIAEAPAEGGTLYLPSPAAGIVSAIKVADMPKRLLLRTVADKTSAEIGERLEPSRAAPEIIRNALSRGGIWPLFWSSKTQNTPTLNETERPRAIIINCVSAEPFRTRGKVILRRAWNRIVQGIRFLPRLMADYGTVDVVLTDHRNPVARMMYMDLAGHAWVRFHSLPVIYPVEHPVVLSRALRQFDRSASKDAVIWVIDIQGVAAVGACLAEGQPLGARTVAIGGPGCVNPRHLQVQIGTPLTSLVQLAEPREECLVLRGGLLSGAPVDPAIESVGYDDDSFFFLPIARQREFLSFMRPGFDRTSRLPCFGSSITRASDRHISNSLRGERRPCIACGLCEQVCPASLLPQVLHRYLYAGALEEAEAAGVDLCVGCGLCTYVCPSKIELGTQFAQAREQIGKEHQETAAAALQREGDAGKQETERKRGKEWLQ